MNTKNNDNVNDKDEKHISKYVYDYGDLFASWEGHIAKNLAETLNDMKNVRYYYSIAHDYSERYLMEICQKVMETPEHKIKKSRGALFAYLVKKYGHFDTDD